MYLALVWYKSKLIIRLRKWYMVNDVLKYRIGNLTLLYCCVYSRLLDTIEIVVWKSIRLIRSIESGSQVNR